MADPAPRLVGMSVCSGIGAPELAAPWIDWRWQSEIEPFPCAVLAERFPGAVNLGDMTQWEEWPDDAAPAVFCGGTPCQSFSIAGLRRGLADPRGNLMLTYLAIARRYQPRWLVWENVPGVLSSNGGRDFGALLRGLGELGYGFAWRVLDAQYVRTRGFSRAVPQRRRRVFLVGHLGDWRRAAAVLFDRESLQGHPAPRREAGERVAPTISARSRGGGGLGTDFDCDGGLIPAVANPLTARMHKGINTTMDEGQTMVAQPIAIQERAVAENPDSGPQGAGYRQDGVAYTLEARHHVQVVAFDAKGSKVQFDETGIAPPLRSMSHSGSHASGGGHAAIATRWAVRRLTPVECERLQGFPDGFTAIPWRGRPAEQCPDGPRYKALGNSWAVNCGEYVFDRLRMVEGMD